MMLGRVVLLALCLSDILPAAIAVYQGCQPHYTACANCCDINRDCICDNICGGNDPRWPREHGYVEGLGCSYRPPQGPDARIQGCPSGYKKCPTCQSTWSLLTVNGLHVRNTHAAVRTTIVARFLVTPFALKATRTLVVKRAVAKVGPMVFTPRAAREMPLLLHPPHFHLRLRIQNNGLPQTPPRLQLLQLSKSNTSKRVAVATTAH